MWCAACSNDCWKYEVSMMIVTKREGNVAWMSEVPSLG